MFSTKLKNDRYHVDCVTLLNNPRVNRFLVDTGARYTCSYYRYIDSSISETSFIHAESKLLGGFVSGNVMKFYACLLKQFTIGSIDLGPQKIWITFDERISDNVMGMDILKHIVFLNHPSALSLSFYEDTSELKNAIN